MKKGIAPIVYKAEVVYIPAFATVATLSPRMPSLRLLKQVQLHQCRLQHQYNNLTPIYAENDCSKRLHSGPRIHQPLAITRFVAAVISS